MLRPTVDRRLLWSAAESAAACGVSQRTWWRLDAAGKVPAAVLIGKSKRWRADELTRWVEQGCPDRAKWARHRAAEDGKSTGGNRTHR
jgi:predicted DNA-binding transcriptional regulator AlpA